MVSWCLPHSSHVNPLSREDGSAAGPSHYRKVCSILALLMIRMLFVLYGFAICSPVSCCKVKVNPAYPWFRKLTIEDQVRILR